MSLQWGLDTSIPRSVVQWRSRSASAAAQSQRQFLRGLTEGMGK